MSAHHTKDGADLDDSIIFDGFCRDLLNYYLR